MIDKNKPYFITSKNFHGDKEYFYKGVTGDCERTSCSGSLQLSKSAMNALYFYKKVKLNFTGRLIHYQFAPHDAAVSQCQTGDEESPACWFCKSASMIFTYLYTC